MRSATFSAALLLLLATAQEPPIDFDRAGREIVRVAPVYFLHLPRPVRDVLDARGCTVPQTWGDAKWPGNAVRGHFMSASSDDWAVLCSRSGTSSILVISGGKVVAALAPSTDRDHLEGMMPGQAVYTRKVGRITPKDIKFYCRTFRQRCPPIRHDGIEDTIKSNASEVRYFDGSTWRLLPGVD
jgi:hypothetical protein